MPDITALPLSVVTFCYLVYVLPSLIALVRERKDFVPIVFTNLFLGWTGVCWVRALRRAMNGEE